MRCAMGKLLILATLLLGTATAGMGETLCKLDNYKASAGLTAANDGSALAVTWDGRNGQELRLRLGIVSGTPTIQEIAVRAKGGAWATLGSNITPEFNVVTGRRRLDQEAYPALKEAFKGEVTQQVLDHYKWDAFWDAPLRIPGDEIAHGDSTPPPHGIPGTNQLPLPRTEAEVTRATASYQATGCSVKTDAGRLESSF